MTVLHIYFCSVVLTVCVDSLYNKIYKKHLKNKGYEYKIVSSNIYSKIIIGFINFMFDCIPIFNIIYICHVLLNLKRLIKDDFEYDLKKGNIHPIKEMTKIVDVNQMNINLTKEKEMTREEKIKFLREEYKRLTSEELSYNVKEKSKIGIKRR